MAALADALPWIVGMVVLIFCSGFFSASEAALFYLKIEDRRSLAQGNASQRSAAALLADPERLLSAVLLWNLVVNIAYYSLASVVTLRLESDERGGSSLAVGFTAGALLAIIFLSEMLPKSIAVLSAKRLAGFVGLPLSAAVRVLDPLMPILTTINLLSRRLFWPTFSEEKSLELSDLERAIEVSATDAEFVKHERFMLKNIVLLSDIRVDEWMRPRTEFLTFRPPVKLEQLGHRMTPSGYLLITETDSDHVAAAIHLRNLHFIPQNNLESIAKPVVYVPWCSTVAGALQVMKSGESQVAVVVDEFGATIGVLTFDDIIDTVFHYTPSKTGRLVGRTVTRIGENTWEVTGVTSMRRLCHKLEIEAPTTTMTVAGVIQEELQRLAEVGDVCNWGNLEFSVTKAPRRGHLLVTVSITGDQE